MMSVLSSTPFIVALSAPDRSNVVPTNVHSTDLELAGRPHRNKLRSPAIQIKLLDQLPRHTRLRNEIKVVYRGFIRLHSPLRSLLLFVPHNNLANAPVMFPPKLPPLFLFPRHC